MLAVCKKMFQNIYRIKRGRVDVMIQKKKKVSITGISPKSGTGAHTSHNFLQEERTHILNHIKSFPAYESHSRKNTSLLYLSPNLNIQNMFDLYKEQCVSNGKDYPSNWLYRDVFGETGLKFKLLYYVDTCKTCDEFNIKFKYLTGEELEVLIERNNIHKNMFDSAYKSKQEDKALLNTTPTLKIIVSDLQTVSTYS